MAMHYTDVGNPAVRFWVPDGWCGCCNRDFGRIIARLATDGCKDAADKNGAAVTRRRQAEDFIIDLWREGGGFAGAGIESDDVLTRIVGAFPNPGLEKTSRIDGIAYLDDVVYPVVTVPRRLTWCWGFDCGLTNIRAGPTGDSRR